MFTIDFTKPWLYKDITYFNQGNLSTNNTLRCKLVTGGFDDFTGGSIACTFTIKDSVEISGFGKLVDAKNGIIDIVFPSNSLVVGNNKLEILVNRADGGVAQSPPVMYDIWQGLTTGNGVEAETNYPILIELINSTNEVSNTAKEALNKVNSMKVEMEEIIDFSYRAANNADIAASNANYKIDEVDEKIKEVDRSLAAGTKDLEVKEARKDANGVVHDTLEQRLASDLIVGDKSLKDFVVDMNVMKETQDLAYETNTGYKVCKDTQVGVVKDLKISGKTLVNVTYGDLPKQGSCTFESIIATATQRELKVTKEGSCVIMRKGMFKKNTDYTIIAKVKYVSSVNDLSFSFKQIDGSYTISQTNVKKNNTSEYTDYVVKLNTYNYDIESIVIGYHASLPVNSILGVKDVLVLEGDYIQNLPSYFEGIASVGNVNGIGISTRKEDGNLIDINKIDAVRYAGDVVTSKWYVRDNSICVDNITKDYETSIFYYIKVEQNETYSINVNDLNCGILLYQGIVNGHVSANHITSLTSSAKKFTFLARRDYITVRVSAETYKGNLFAEGIMLNKGDIKPYEPYKGDKKQVLFKDTYGKWKPVTELSEFDILDAGRNELLVKSDKVVINETKDWSVNAENSTTIRFATQIIGMAGNRNPIICDRYKLKTNYDLNLDSSEGAFTSSAGSTLYFDILKSNLSTPDVSGLKALLKVKNVTVVFRTIDTTVYEVNPLEVESYNNETMISFGSAVIAPYASWKITSSLPNFVKALSNQIKQLQEQVYKTNVANFTVALNTLDTKLRLDRLEAPQQ